MKGFGGNPLEKESWWMMTREMAIRAAHYGIFHDIEKFTQDNGLFNFALKLVKGSDMRRLAGTNYAENKALKANPKPHELEASKILEDNGHTVYFTPENIHSKNYDAIIDGRIGEFKGVEKFKNIRDGLNRAVDQGASIVALSVPTAGHTISEAEAIIQDWFKTCQKGVKKVDTVYLIWDEIIKIIKK